jgi:hypothetical protein
VDEPETHTGEATEPGPENEPGFRGHAERLGQQLADLYNENTLLRERVRVLEQRMRAPVKPA